MKIRFLGATHTVTGSKTLIQAGKIKLLVDCGVFQGLKELRLRNWQPLSIKPSEIDFILLTHAHIDHSGYIPLLIKQGFKGKIYCSQATRDLCDILLPDSGHIQEEEARYANLKGYSKHKPALPLYTREEAEYALKFFKTIDFEQTVNLSDDLHFQLFYGGHILGASLIRITHQDTSLLFTGDLGRPDDPIMYPPVACPAADYYVIESTYGNRLHEDIDPEQQLAQIINDTVDRGGKVLIPSFAVGRAQLILYFVHRLKVEKRIPDLPVFLDSPMATDATKLFCQHAKLHRLSDEESAQVCQTAHYIQSREESKGLNSNNKSMIIISASGMATGGRVLHHLSNIAPDPKSSIVFCGYQAQETRGERMIHGADKIKMHGQIVPIKAKVHLLHNTSAHVDYGEMLDWLKTITVTPKKIFINHGEAEAAQALQEKITATFNWPCVVPDYEYEQDLN